jgi:rare lipoprotein A
MATGDRRVGAISPIAVLGLLLAGCVSQPGYYGAAGQGSYRVGAPYEIKGVWYYPAVDYNYDRTGVASWYGEQFEGRLTANGEIFDLNQLSAAHTTLPMPSIVQVTNLQNGRSLQLRVNDRGPFVNGRLIDVSRRAAQLLGFESKGTTLVRVRVLKEESIAAAEEAMHGGGQTLVADAAPAAAAPAPAASVAYAPPAALPPAAASRAVPPRPARDTVVPLPPRPPTPEPRPSPEPQIAMAPSEAPPTPAPTLPPRTPVPPARYRFSLIAPAEAAEAPPARARATSPMAALARAPQGQAAGQHPSPGRIYVQAGAFSLPDNARRVQSRIANLGSVAVTATSVNGVELYRVRLGPFDSAAEADRLLARLVGDGYPEARVVNN